MAITCKTFWSLEHAYSSHEKASCKLSLWPFSQVAPLSSSSCSHLKRSHRDVSIACTAREILVSQSQEVSPSSFPEDFQGASLEDGPQGAAQGSCEVDQGLQVSQKSSQVRFKEDEQAELQLKEDEDEEWLKGFPGAKGALVKPLSSESLTYFPEGYLDTVSSIDRWDWVTIVPTRMLPKGDRLVLEHNKESVILFWFKGKIYALENRSPAAPMFEEGFAKAVISEDGLVTCPITESKYDIRTGATVVWLPKSSLLEKMFSPTVSDLSVYAVKASPDHIFIHRKRLLVGGYYPLAEFTGNRIWEGPDELYNEPIIFDDLEFGFTDDNELTNGRFAMLGFLTLLILEMTTGEGILKGSGILDFLYKFLPGFPVLRY